LKTGLSTNATVLLKYLYKTGKYDIALYATQGTPTNHPLLSASPWPVFGCIPPDQNLINQINADPNLARDASYGSINIDAVIKEWKPTIWIGSDDAWSFSLANYADKPWFNRIHSLHHITIDSVPVLEQAYEQAKRSKIYLTWAKFAAREMQAEGKQRGIDLSHVSSIYGAMDTQAFSPISAAEKANLRRQFGIPDDTIIFLFVGRNQLRKSMPRILEAYARFRKDHPNVRAALHFHTSFSERAQGWDLPKRAADYGIAPQELLCTYVCKTCGSWFVAPFGGEDLDCPACGAQKSVVTANIINGVPADQMRLIYGLSDACISAFTSGGQEYHNVQSLLCGKTLACTNYSCGEDFCTPETRGFVTPLKWHPYDEQATNFVKAATDVGDITAFMRSHVRTPKAALEAAGARGREWAIKTFGIEAIGAQWEKLFDSLPVVDWSTIDLTKPAAKNETFPMPTMTDNVEWVKTLYREILLMSVTDQDSGLSHWLTKLSEGMARQSIFDYFISVAKQENQKNGITTQTQTNFASLLDNTGRKRALLLVKESIGDCLMMTSLFESFHQQYPNHDLYVMTSTQYAGIFDGNPYVYRVLPYIPQAENELMMIGAGQEKGFFDVYFHPAIQSQRQLNYLSNINPIKIT
jgi:glycosyltransferase involved in cell wall biosynthesis